MRHAYLRLTLGTFLILGRILVGVVYAECYVVNPQGTGDFPTIQAAVDAAVDGDIVELTDGTFTGPGNRNVDYSGKAITIRSQSGDPSGCLVDCGGVHRGFDFRSGEGAGSVLEGVTVVNGLRDPGGAVRCWSGASPMIRGCVFASNEASMIGGAICCVSDAAPTISNCTFSDNTATFGGAVICWVHAEVTIIECTFIGNEATFGGAIECADDATVFVEGCTFRENSASRGGAIMSEEAAHTLLLECTLYENAAEQNGAGLCVEAGSYADIRNTIVAASSCGEAIYCSGSSAVTLACTDLFDNAGGDWVGSIADQYGVNGNISEDPLFCDAEEGDLTLAVDSPCAPFTPPNPECDLIGAWPVGCDPQALPHGVEQVGPYLTAPAPSPFTSRTFIRYATRAATEWVPVSLRSHDPEGRLVRMLSEEDLGGAPRRAARDGTDQRAAHVLLRVVDPAGRIVRTLVDGLSGPGSHVTAWDGTDEAGRPVQAGVYFLHLSVDASERVRRVALIR